MAAIHIQIFPLRRPVIKYGLTYLPYQFTVWCYLCRAEILFGQAGVLQSEHSGFIYFLLMLNTQKLFSPQLVKDFKDSVDDVAEGAMDPAGRAEWNRAIEIKEAFHTLFFLFSRKD